MKCNSCGGALKIEYKLCPNCGTANPYFEGHRADMEKYDKAFEKTQEEVIKKTKKNAGILIKMVICAVLFAATIVMFILTTNVWSIQRNQIKKDVAKNSAKYISTIKQMETDREYIKMDKWYEAYNLNGVETLNEYKTVHSMSQAYTTIFTYICDISGGTYADENSYRKPADVCDSISERYDAMVKLLTPKDYDSEEQYKEEHMACMLDCIGEAKALIQGTFHLSDEEMVGFDELTQSKRAVLLEEHWPCDNQGEE